MEKRKCIFMKKRYRFIMGVLSCANRAWMRWYQPLSKTIRYRSVNVWKICMKKCGRWDLPQIQSILTLIISCFSWFIWQLSRMIVSIRKKFYISLVKAHLKRESPEAAVCIWCILLWSMQNIWLSFAKIFPGEA